MDGTKDKDFYERAFHESKKELKESRNILVKLRAIYYIWYYTILTNRVVRVVSDIFVIIAIRVMCDALVYWKSELILIVLVFNGIAHLFWYYGLQMPAFNASSPIIARMEVMIFFPYSVLACTAFLHIFIFTESMFPIYVCYFLLHLLFIVVKEAGI